MKGMILAAGLGTRLKPYTLYHPKALYPYEGRPLIWHAIQHLRSAGIREIIINVHHFADQIRAFLNQDEFRDCQVTISDEHDFLLETGGGVKKAAWFFRNTGDFVVRNVDIISGLDLNAIIRHHQEGNHLATLAVRRRHSGRYLLFDNEMKLSGWENRKTGEQLLVTDNGIPLQPYAFSGIQCLNSRIFPQITEEGSFSLVSLYLRLAKRGEIFGYPEKEGLWLDAGSGFSSGTQSG